MLAQQRTTELGFPPLPSCFLQPVGVFTLIGVHPKLTAGAGHPVYGPPVLVIVSGGLPVGGGAGGVSDVQKSVTDHTRCIAYRAVVGG